MAGMSDCIAINFSLEGDATKTEEDDPPARSRAEFSMLPLLRVSQTLFSGRASERDSNWEALLDVHGSITEPLPERHKRNP